jgi:hypothetical protein
MSQSSSSRIVIGLLIFLLVGAIIGLGILGSRSSSLTSKLDDAEKELEDKKTELIKKTKEYDELSKKLEGKDDQTVKLAEKEAEIVKLKADIAAIGVRINNYSTFVTQLKTNLLAISNNKAINAIDNDIEKYNTVLSAISAVLSDKDDIIKNLDSKTSSTDNQAALSRLLSGGKTFVQLEAEYKNLTTLKDAFNRMVTTINDSLASITVATASDGSINIPSGVVISENKVLDKLNEHKNYISVTRKLINDMIVKLGTTDIERNPATYSKASDVLDLLNRYITATTNAENNYKAKISALEEELSRYRLTNNRIPVSFLKDTILFGLDINTYRPEDIGGANNISNQGYTYEPRHAAQDICANDRHCASTTFSSADMIPFHVTTRRGINDSDSDNSYNMCEASGGTIDTIYEFHVQAFDQNNADDVKNCPRQRIKTTGLLPNILGKNSIKINDLNTAGDPCPGVRKNWTFTVGCTKPVGVFLNSAHDGTKFMPTKIANRNATWNVGISKPHFIDWKNSLDGKDPFTYNENLKTLDFTKLNNAASGSTGILFRNTELGGQDLGPSREVNSLKECVDYLNSYGTIPTKAAIISKDAASNYKFICQPRGKVPAKGAVAATSTSAAQPAVPEQNIKLFRNIGSSNAWDVYVPGGVVPDFDF